MRFYFAGQAKFSPALTNPCIERDHDPESEEDHLLRLSRERLSQAEHGRSSNDRCVPADTV
jgi:hypothetical protein